jgi:hypothetical protein
MIAMSWPLSQLLSGAVMVRVPSDAFYGER